MVEPVLAVRGISMLGDGWEFPRRWTRVRCYIQEFSLGGFSGVERGLVFQNLAATVDRYQDQTLTHVVLVSYT